jgi:hypothetical protein
MPQAIFIKGCGRMVCSSYAEVTAAMDQAYAVPPDQPLPVDQIFASLAREASRERLPHKDAPSAPPPAHAPEPG